MQVQKLTHEVRLQKWSEIIRSCRNSGKPIKTWCSENNINLKTYYHWQKHVCQATCRELSLPQKATTPVVSQPEGPVFAELRLPTPQTGTIALTIQRQDTQIHIYHGADAATVQAALTALNHPC